MVDGKLVKLFVGEIELTYSYHVTSMGYMIVVGETIIPLSSCVKSYSEEVPL